MPGVPTSDPHLEVEGRHLKVLAHRLIVLEDDGKLHSIKDEAVLRMAADILDERLPDLAGRSWFGRQLDTIMQRTLRSVANVIEGERPR